MTAVVEGAGCQPVGVKRTDCRRNGTGFEINDRATIPAAARFMFTTNSGI